MFEFILACQNLNKEDKLKKTPLLMAASVLLFSLNAAQEAPALSQEFPFIQPVSIEEAPLEVLLALDSDGDGVADENDKCPDTTKGVSVDAFGCEIENDSDNDGVSDADDACPNTPSGIKVDHRGCEVDSDGDGVADSKDRCPDTSKEFMVDGYGCPQTATLKVHFGSGEYKVNDELVREVEEFALFLKENRGYQVILFGYTDNLGSKEANKLLSQNRANSVKEALLRYGISETRLTTIGKGVENPIADNATPEGRAQNRRIEVELVQ